MEPQTNPSKFVQVKCKCGNEQVVFGRAKTIVKCNKCETELAIPNSSNAKILAKITKVLE